MTGQQSIHSVYMTYASDEKLAQVVRETTMMLYHIENRAIVEYAIRESN
jgi:hypothetical protein